MFLGDNIIVYLVLALGGALAVGNVAALVRPPSNEKKSDTKKDDEENTDLEKAPVVRSLVMAIIGATAAVWAIASLIK
ncbi:MAG: hypothetical protein RLZ67_259 [Actinomycetota bacterium]|jgi:hypothetical protein